MPYIRQHLCICNKLISTDILAWTIYQSRSTRKGFVDITETASEDKEKICFDSKHWVAREMRTKLEGESLSNSDVFV